MVRRIGIANRGEIAARIARTVEEMGLEPLPLRPRSFLEIEAVLEAARAARADAVHPGYGFLSESAELAEACARAGIVFIGPPPLAMRRSGDKLAARAAASAAGVPVLPATENLAEAPHKLGLPLMLKAAGGGGGKGMRRVERAEDLPAAAEAARREARAAFGDERLYAERVLSGARHIEVQIVADAHGGIFALGERECSLQRRFQKIIEEAPSPAVDPALRRRLQEAAIAVAREIGYVNAGTVEFLVGPDGSFHFIEINARLQVEHPVTECVTGLDLVRLQIEVATGVRLRLPDLPPRGHAIEARICAERPWEGFLPATGRILRLSWPQGVRVDHALYEGDEVTADFDPLLAKMIAWAPDRQQARARLVRALRSTVLLGVPTNLDYLAALLETPEFRRGETAVDRLPQAEPPEPPPEAFAAALAAGAAATSSGRRSVWESLGPWRLSP